MVAPRVWDRCTAGRWGWDSSGKGVHVRQAETEVLEGGASGMGRGSNWDLRAEARHEELPPWLSTGRFLGKAGGCEPRSLTPALPTRQPCGTVTQGGEWGGGVATAVT